MAADDDRGLERRHLLDRLEPAEPVRVGVGEDREEGVLDQIAGEQHPLLGQEDQLVAFGVDRTDVDQLDRATTEVDRQATGIGEVGRDQIDLGEHGRQPGAEATEHLTYSAPFSTSSSAWEAFIT